MSVVYKTSEQILKISFHINVKSWKFTKGRSCWTNVTRFLTSVVYMDVKKVLLNCVEVISKSL